MQHDADRMAQMILLLLGLVLLQGSCSMGHSYLTAWVSQRVMADFRIHLFAHLETLSVNFFSKRRTGELMSRLMNDVTVIQNVVTDTPIDAAKRVVTFIGGAGFLFAMNWQLCLLILVLLPCWLSWPNCSADAYALSTTIQDQTASVSTLVEEVIAGIRVVKSFVQTKREEQRFVSQVQTAMELSLRRATAHGLVRPDHYLRHLRRCRHGAVVWRQAGHRRNRVSRRPVRFRIVCRHSDRTIRIRRPRLCTDQREAQGAMQRVFEILDTHAEIADAPNAIELPPIKGHVRRTYRLCLTPATRVVRCLL